MKKLLVTISLITVFSMSYAQDFSVPERTIVQKHNRAVYLTYLNIITAIAYAKSTGKTAADYSVYTGDLFKTSWNKENGFNGFVNGVLGNYESFRRDQDPPMEILEQSQDNLVLKWKINYKNIFEDGPRYNVTYEDFNQWFDIVYNKIADYLGATYEQEVMEGDWLKITIIKK